jgi:pimeloyl-ACP methyl ester carboxylesterase
MQRVTEGRFTNGVPYLRLGEGPPLLVASGLTSTHDNPSGMARRMALSWAAPFAEHFTVHVTNRRAGLPDGVTMSDLATDYAAVIEQDIGEPVLLHGTSTGGSVALQLAVDRPDLVRRMVVSAAACRLSEHGRAIQAELARLGRERDGRGSAALLFEEMSRPPFRRPARALGWLVGGSFVAEDPTDMLRVIAAEDTFDAEPELQRIQAPTLVIGGGADAFYSEELFRRTAAAIPDGRAVVLPGKSHIHVAGAKVPAAIGLGFLLGS